MKAPGGLLIAGGIVLASLGTGEEDRHAAVLENSPGLLRRADCRLTGDVQPEPRPGGPWPASPVRREELSRISRMADALAVRHGRETSAAGRAGTLHALGQLRLAEGRTAEAIAAFETLLLEAPPRAATLSDLSAAYLMRSREGRPFDLVLALVSANRALALEADHPEALFNRA
jgi:hypothetical protein